MRVVALGCCDTMGIASQNGIRPWGEDEDYKSFFINVIRNNTAVMGRLTWEKLAPIPDCRSIVISGSQLRAEHYPRLFPALKNIEKGTVFLLGGERIYEEAFHMGVVSEIWISKFHNGVTSRNGTETFFPMPNLRNWIFSSRESRKTFTTEYWRKKS